MVGRLLLLAGMVACGRADVPGVSVSDARLPVPADTTVASAYFTIHNRGPADTLVAVVTDFAREASVHASADENGVRRMRPVDALIVPSGSATRLAPGGLHVMLESLTRRPQPGDTIVLTLTFRQAGAMRVPFCVVRYEDLIP